MNGTHFERRLIGTAAAAAGPNAPSSVPYRRRGWLPGFMFIAALIAAVALIVPVWSQSSASFADRVVGAMQITVGSWTPPAPPATPIECADLTFGQVLVGTSGDDTFDAGNGRALIFGLGGNDTITGGNGKDCLVGGDGMDECHGTINDTFEGCETVIGVGVVATAAPADLPLPSSPEATSESTPPTAEPTPSGADPTPVIDPTPVPVDPTAAPLPEPSPPG